MIAIWCQLMYGNIITWLTFIVGYIANWRIFKKAGVKGWKGLIPMYSSYALGELGMKNGWLIVIISTPIYIFNIIRLLNN